MSYLAVLESSIEGANRTINKKKKCLVGVAARGADSTRSSPYLSSVRHYHFVRYGRANYIAQNIEIVEKCVCRNKFVAGLQ